MWYFPILVYLTTLTFLLFRAIANRWRIEDWKLLLILLAGIIYFRTALGRSDWHHVIYSSSYFWLICFFFFEGVWLAYRLHRTSEIASKAEMKGKPVKADLYKPLEKAETMLVHFVKYGTIPQGYVEVRLKRAGRILAPANQAAQIEQVVKYLQENTAPSEPIFDFANQGVYYFLANRPNPTRFPQIYYALPEPLQKEVIADLEETKPKYVIFGVWNSNRLPLVTAYLQSHYTEDIQLGNVAIWKRREGL